MAKSILLHEAKAKTGPITIPSTEAKPQIPVVSCTVSDVSKLLQGHGAGSRAHTALFSKRGEGPGVSQH